MPQNLKLRSIRKLEFAREFRDPVYNYIHVTNFENEVIDSEIFQRLDGLSQMPTARYVYPSGVYSRKTHSLGAMHLMNKAILHILYLHSEELRGNISPLLFGESVVFREDRDALIDQLSKQGVNDWWDSKELDEIIQYSRLAGLLHDIGHAPFSHTFEDLTKRLFERKEISIEFDHEKMSRDIIKEKETDLNLGKPFKAEEIIDILNKDDDGKAPKFLKELINGPYDCDKLDYLMRDSYHVGTPEYGNIDVDRIIDGFRVKDRVLCISSSALHAVMSSFRAIQSMYTAIYYHRTSRVFDLMIADALSEVPEFIEEIISSIDEFLKYDDHSIVYAIQEKAHGENSLAERFKKASKILKMVRNRQKTYKTVLEYPLSFPLVAIIDPEKDIQETESEIMDFVAKCHAKDFNIRCDYRPSIRPIGIESGEILKWLIKARIYDSMDNKVKTLEEISSAYSDDLGHYTILFRVFADKKKYKDDEHTARKIGDESKERLEELQKKWRRLS
jgi:HD superfamily phosphohydrolase